MCPFVAERQYGADARGFEELAEAVFRVVAPDVDVVGGEGERLYPAVAYGGSACRTVGLQYYLPFFGDRSDQIVNDARQPALDDRVGQRAVVVDRVEFAFEVLFQKVVVVDVFDGAFEDHGLLLGEMDQLRNILEVRRFLVQPDVFAALLDDETRFAEGVDVAVDGAARHHEPLGQVVDRVFGVGREHLHQPQQPFEFGLVHACSGTETGKRDPRSRFP